MVEETTHLKFVTAKDVHDGTYMNEELQLINTEDIDKIEVKRDIMLRQNIYRAYEINNNSKWLAFARRIPKLVLTDSRGNNPRFSSCDRETSIDLQQYCMDCG